MMSRHPLDPSPTVGARLKRAAERLRVKPLTHEERRKLIEAPFFSHTIPGKSWAGVLIQDRLPTEGRAAFSDDPEDEEYGSIGMTRRLVEEMA